MRQSANAIAKIRNGIVGEFVPVLDPPVRRWLSGSLRLEEEQAVATLIADDAAFDEEGFPVECPALAGRTETGDVLLVAIGSRGSRRGHLDVVTYRTKHLLTDVDLEEVDGDTVTSLRMGYHGLINWVPSRIYREDAIVEDDKTVGWKAELRYGTGLAADISDGFSLRFSSGWEVGGTFDRRTFATPLNVTVESDGRRPIGEHVARLDAVHALLNIAHRGDVKSFGGSARLVDGPLWSGFWETNMMTSDALDQGMHEFPYLGLEDVGGIDGIARWVELVLKHHRAVVPLVRHTIFTNQTPESRLLSTASAMESWVAANRRTASWAKKVQNEDLPGALMRKVDRSWDEWVGDPDKWCTDFWHAYTCLKHRPEVELDSYRVHMLEVAGRWLLTAALLDECSGTLSASQHLFGRSLSMIGNGVREALAEPSA